jgi:hypothetical protein
MKIFDFGAVQKTMDYKDMKSILSKICLLLIVFPVFSIISFSQEKFDIVSFKTPASWQKEIKPNAVRFGKEDVSKGTFCLMMLFKSVAADEDSKKNFQTSWQAIVKGSLAKVSDPQLQPTATENGWNVESGMAQYENDGAKGVAMLVSATGGGKSVNLLILTNTDAYQAETATFIESLVLPKVETQKETPVSQTNESNQRLIGKWQRAGSIAPKYGDPVSSGMAGSIKSRYEFKTDGSYVFTQRVFGMSNSKIIIVKENGTYKIDGNKITIAPKKSLIESYAKSGGGNTLGQRLSSENRPLETVAYQFTFHYFSGIKEWNLVLQADSPTQRDGEFSSLKVFENAWYFDQKYTDEDLTAP